MRSLESIWDQIGITGDQRNARKGVVRMHLGNLLDEMVNEENSLRSRLMENVDKYKAEVTQLCKELNLSPYEVCWIMLCPSFSTL
jgi:Ase1/PRC1/MAP65 family protein